MLWKQHNQNGRWIQRLAQRAALVITCTCNQDHHNLHRVQIPNISTRQGQQSQMWDLRDCLVVFWLMCEPVPWATAEKNARGEDESAGRSREYKTTAPRAPRTILFAPPTNLPAVLHGDPSVVHSPGVLGEPQRVQLRTHQTENVPGSALQHHLYAQPAEPLRPADCCTGYGGRLVVTLSHFFFFLCACE